MAKKASTKSKFEYVYVGRRLSTESLQYYTDYDYRNIYSCDDHCCSEEGICRCAMIVDEELKSIDMPRLVDGIYEMYNPTDKTSLRDSKLKSVLFDSDIKEIDTYCIDRICRVMRVYDTNNWMIEVCGGYYGQEVNDVKFDNIKSLEANVEKVLAFDTLKEKVEFLLTLEYGHILPELVDKNYELVEVFKENIIIGSEGQYRKVATEDLSHYDDNKYSGIRGIVMRRGKKYRLIDGYHRMYSTKLSSVQVLSTV